MSFSPPCPHCGQPIDEQFVTGMAIGYLAAKNHPAVALTPQATKLLLDTVEKVIREATAMGN